MYKKVVVIRWWCQQRKAPLKASQRHRFTRVYQLTNKTGQCIHAFWDSGIAVMRGTWPWHLWRSLSRPVCPCSLIFQIINHGPPCAFGFCLHCRGARDGAAKILTSTGMSCFRFRVESNSLELLAPSRIASLIFTRPLGFLAPRLVQGALWHAEPCTYV